MPNVIVNSRLFDLCTTSGMLSEIMDLALMEKIADGFVVTYYPVDDESVIVYRLSVVVVWMLEVLTVAGAPTR